MPTALVTGANRGIGLGLVKELLCRDWQVLACCRNPSVEELKALAGFEQLRLFNLDVTSEDDIRKLAKACTHPIDVLMNVAGIYGPSKVRFGDTPVEPWLEVFKVNTIAPLKICEALVEQIANSGFKLAVAISSEMGSIANNKWGNAYLYRSSKAALNAVVKSLSIDLAEKGIISIAVHPGWVKTDMGGPDATLSIEKSCHHIIDLVSKPELLASGEFYDYLGNKLAW